MKTIIIDGNNAKTARLRDDALKHIEETYRRAFSAEMRLRPPRLAVTLARDGQIACAAAIRCHDEGFFSQHYLRDPISDVLSRQAGLCVAARDILEVGGLACASPFAAYPLLQAVFEWGRERQIGWGLFTATGEIRRLIRRARITPVMLAQANAAQVPDPAEWGSYYEHDPWVCAFRDPAQITETAFTQAVSA